MPGNPFGDPETAARREESASVFELPDGGAASPLAWISHAGAHLRAISVAERGASTFVLLSRQVLGSSEVSALVVELSL
jgi:hypothetical protein